MNVVDQMSFYASYHSVLENQLIHIAFVPVILWSAFVWAANVGPSYLNLSLLAWCGYGGYYVALDPKTGSVAAAFYFALYLSANAFVAYGAKTSTVKGNSRRNLSKWTPSLVALALHVLGWWMQIVPGHTWIEKRKPALMDSFIQSLVLAPLFIVYEALWMLIPGYEPEMKAQLTALVAKQHREWGQ